MNEKHKKVCRALHYFEYFIAFVSVVIGFISISAFASLVGVRVSFVRYIVRKKDLCSQ